MTTEDFKRKLTAILSADVVGYGRLMGDNEEYTVRTLNKYKMLIFNLIEKNNGRVIDSPGDNVLSEFTSVVDAVRCGDQIQKDLKEKNKELTSSRKMEFRIGIHTGDVIQDGDRIYGDGVNVAARIESLADPGGICISRTAYDQVKGKIIVEYEYMGEYEVKNIREPVRVYKIHKEKSEMKIATESKTHNLSEKPSIAVLPFLNLSSDPEQEYFVDGLTEEILNSLAQINDLTVMARTSSFSFKGTNKTIQEIAYVLGVKNVLEGSVRKAGTSLRITAQLIKSTDGSHLWSKTYNRELKDIFAVQEDIATSVADELKVRLGISKSFKQLGGTNNLESYERYLVAKGLHLQDASIGLYRREINLLDKAISLDSGFALAWALKGVVHWLLASGSFADQVSLELDKGLEAARMAIELEPNLGEAYLTLGLIQTVRGKFVEAGLAYRKGLELATESIDLFNYGLYWHDFFVGYFEKSIENLEKMRKKDPLHPFISAYYMSSLTDIDRAEGEYERGKAIFGGQWSIGDLQIIWVRLRLKNKLSKNDIPEVEGYGRPFAILRDHLESPEDGLTELHRFYHNNDNLLPMDFMDIAGCAAYFGDPEFAMNVIEESINLFTLGIAFYFTPVFREVRKLPRFKKYIKTIGLVEYWKKFGWPDYNICRPIGDDDFECD